MSLQCKISKILKLEFYKASVTCNVKTALERIPYLQATFDVKTVEGGFSLKATCNVKKGKRELIKAPVTCNVNEAK